MNITDKTILEKFTKELSILHYGLTFGAFAVTILIYFFAIEGRQFNFADTGDIFLYLCPLIAIGGVFGGIYMFNNKIKTIDRAMNLEEKLVAYRAATVQKFSLTEGPALICVVALMQTENLLYLIIALVLIAHLFSQKISKEKIVEELGL